MLSQPVTLPSVDFKIGCHCATCNLGVLIPWWEGQGLSPFWVHWWHCLLAFRLWDRQGNDAVCCRWQLWRLSGANGGATVRALAAKLDVEGAPGPTLRGDQSLFVLPPREGASS